MRLAPFLLALAFLIAPALMRPAQSQTLCGPTADVMAEIAGKFAEKPIAHGFVGPVRAARMIFFVNETTGTWTLVIVTPKGAACIAAAGYGFKLATPARPAGKDL